MDRISNLPDEVLTHILSFLPTKQAVATGVLSTRWTHLWLSVSILDFSVTDVTNREASSHFTQFVDSVLHRRDPTQLIKNFRLSRENKFITISRVKKWIDIVSLRRVEHMHLKWLGTCPRLPRGIFTCKTLVVLKLEASFVVNAKSSSLVELPSLKILNLERIELQTYGCFMRFLSGCPNLEDLRTDHINVQNLVYDKNETGEFKSLALSKLTRADIVNSEVYFSFKATENIKFLRMEIDKTLHDVYDHAAFSFNNLTHMELIFFKYGWHLLFKVLKHCPMLQNLVLDETDMDEKEDYVKDDEATWVEPEFVPECFSFHLRTCTIRNFVGQRDELRLAKFIMKNAKVLQTFTICSQGQVRRIERKLSSCEWGSATCQLLVY